MAKSIIIFPPLLTRNVGDPNFAPGATSDNTITAITYTSSNTVVATIVAGLIHLTGIPGFTIITANQAAGAGFLAADSKSQGLTVEQAEPVDTIVITQPEDNSIHSAYRPLIFQVKTNSISFPAVAPPVMYCDIYLNDQYYKTISKTQWLIKTPTSSTWEFDVQDAVQEYFTKFIEDNGETSIVDFKGALVLVYCRFRGSNYDANGFIVQQGTRPTQGTLFTAPVSGSGFQSNVFYAINSVLQHEDNQNLSVHLNSYKNGQWDSSTYPLSHRPNHYKICRSDSDTFGILTDKIPAKLTLHYTTKAGVVGAVDLSPLCQSAGFLGVIYPTLPSAQNDVAYSYSINLSGTAPFTLNILNKPSWMTIALSGNTLTFGGTPHDYPVDNYEVSFEISNCSPVKLQFRQMIYVALSATCTPPNWTYYTFPNATVGTTYTQTIAFTGTPPFTVSANGLPSWLTASFSGSNLVITGTPSNTYLNQQQIIDLNIVGACGISNLWQAIYVLSSAKTVNWWNETADDVTIQLTTGTFVIPAGQMIPIAMNDGLVTITMQTGSDTYECHVVLGDAPSFSAVGAVQGNSFDMGNPAFYNFVTIT